MFLYFLILNNFVMFHITQTLKKKKSLSISISLIPITYDDNESIFKLGDLTKGVFECDFIIFPFFIGLMTHSESIHTWAGHSLTKIILQRDKVALIFQRKKKKIKN
jgi:hypothetical protein